MLSQKLTPIDKKLIAIYEQLDSLYQIEGGLVFEAYKISERTFITRSIFLNYGLQNLIATNGEETEIRITMKNRCRTILMNYKNNKKIFSIKIKKDNNEIKYENLKIDKILEKILSN